MSLRYPGGDLAALVKKLAGGSPSIRTRNHHLKEGYVLIDPRELDVDQARRLAAQLRGEAGPRRPRPPAVVDRARLAGERIHRASEIRLRAVDPELLAALVARLDRRMSLDLTIADRTLYVTFAEETFTGMLEERRLE